MDAADLDVRNATYRTFVALGRPPSAGEVAAEVCLGEDAVRASWTRLHDGHALILDADGEIRMANRFWRLA